MYNMKSMLLVLLLCMTFSFVVKASDVNEDYPTNNVCPIGKTHKLRSVIRGAKSYKKNKLYSNSPIRSALTKRVNPETIAKAQKVAQRNK